MKERPILFNTEMVEALLDGRKTMTRRVVSANNTVSRDCALKKDLDFSKVFDNTPFGVKVAHSSGETIHRLGCKWEVGDVLWVRETFGFTKGKFEPVNTYSYKANSWHRDVVRADECCRCEMPSKIKDENKCYRCKKPFYALLEISEEGWYDKDFAKEIKWKPSIHMPKAACRLRLKITDVRVERLQEISEEDSIDEGIVLLKEETSEPFSAQWMDYLDPNSWWGKPVASFRSLWDSINGKSEEKNWNANPWVWVVSFEKES